MHIIEEPKEKLIRRRDELTARLERLEMDLDAPGSADADDRAIEKEGDEVMESLGLAGQTELKSIAAALERIENGTYGICARCGEPIAPARLAAVPHAPLCLACSEELHPRT